MFCGVENGWGQSHSHLLHLSFSFLSFSCEVFFSSYFFVWLLISFEMHKRNMVMFHYSIAHIQTTRLTLFTFAFCVFVVIWLFFSSSHFFLWFFCSFWTDRKIEKKNKQKRFTFTKETFTTPCSLHVRRRRLRLRSFLFYFHR